MTRKKWVIILHISIVMAGAGGVWALVPWSVLLALLPASAADLMKEEERERRREELGRWLQDAAQLALKWSVRAAQVSVSSHATVG